MKTNVLTLRLIYSDVYYKACHVSSPPCHSVVFSPFPPLLVLRSFVDYFAGFGGFCWGVVGDVFRAWLKGSGSEGYPQFFLLYKLIYTEKEKKLEYLF